MHKKKQNPAITLASLTLSDLKTNYLTEPLGIETTSPITFSWKMKSNTIGQRQTSYQIVVKDSQTGNVMWDSGKQESGRSVAIEYGFNGQFELLQEETKYTWSVTVQASSGTERTSTSFFETGTTWDGAEWITIKTTHQTCGACSFGRASTEFESKYRISALVHHWTWRL